MATRTDNPATGSSSRRRASASSRSIPPCRTKTSPVRGHCEVRPDRPIAAPVPTNAFAPPPNVTPNVSDGHSGPEPAASPVAKVPREASLVHVTMPDRPGADCAETCGDKWNTCRGSCKDRGCETCDQAYRVCTCRCAFTKRGRGCGAPGEGGALGGCRARSPPAVVRSVPSVGRRDPAFGRLGGTIVSRGRGRPRLAPPAAAHRPDDAGLWTGGRKGARGPRFVVRERR